MILKRHETHYGALSLSFRPLPSDTLEPGARALAFVRLESIVSTSCRKSLLRMKHGKRGLLAARTTA